MKSKKLLLRVSIILCLAATFALSGCMMVSCGFVCRACANIGDMGVYYITDDLDNYSLCAFVDDELGIGLKVYNGNNSFASFYWGYITLNGEKRHACFDMYGNGKTHIYITDGELKGDFGVEVGTIFLTFKNGNMVCKKVESDYFNLNLSKLNLKYESLNESDFLPHENAFVKYFSDENCVLSVERSNRQARYEGKARTVTDGEIKTYDILLVFLENDVFEIYNAETNRLLSSGTYNIIDCNTATLKFCQNDNLYSEKPFETYPRLIISGAFFNGIN